MSEIMDIIELPLEIILYISKYLGDIDYTIFMSTCKYLRPLIHIRQIYRQVTINDIYGHPNYQNFMRIRCDNSNMEIVDKSKINPDALVEAKNIYYSNSKKVSNKINKISFVKKNRNEINPNFDIILWDPSELFMETIVMTRYEHELKSIIPPSVKNLELRSCKVGIIDTECLPIGLLSLSIMCTKCDIRYIPPYLKKITLDNKLFPSILGKLPPSVDILSVKHNNNIYPYHLGKNSLPKEIKELEIVFGNDTIIENGAIPDNIVRQNIVLENRSLEPNMISKNVKYLTVKISSESEFQIFHNIIPTSVIILQIGGNFKFIDDGIITDNLEKLYINPKKNSDIDIYLPYNSKLDTFVCLSIINKLKISFSCIKKIELYTLETTDMSEISLNIQKLVVRRYTMDLSKYILSYKINKIIISNNTIITPNIISMVNVISVKILPFLECIGVPKNERIDYIEKKISEFVNNNLKILEDSLQTNPNLIITFLKKSSNVKNLINRFVFKIAKKKIVRTNWFMPSHYNRIIEQGIFAEGLKKIYFHRHYVCPIGYNIFPNSCEEICFPYKIYCSESKILLPTNIKKISSRDYNIFVEGSLKNITHAVVNIHTNLDMFPNVEHIFCPCDMNYVGKIFERNINNIYIKFTYTLSVIFLTKSILNWDPTKTNFYIYDKKKIDINMLHKRFGKKYVFSPIEMIYCIGIKIWITQVLIKNDQN